MSNVRGTRFSIVLRNRGKRFAEASLYNAIKVIDDVKYFAFIQHKPEEDPHIHIAIEYNNEITKNKVLQTFVNITGLDEDGVSVSKSQRINGFILLNQYLTHKNDKDKEPYDVTEVISNDVIKYLEYHNKVVSRELDDDELLTLCLTAKSRIEIIKKIGFENYAHLSRAIEAVLDEREKYEKDND